MVSFYRESHPMTFKLSALVCLGEVLSRTCPRRYAVVTATSGTTTCETLRQHCHSIVGMMVLSACSASKLCPAEDGMGAR